MDTPTTLTDRSSADYFRHLDQLRDALTGLLGTTTKAAARTDVLAAVAAERHRQHTQHGDNTPDSPRLDDLHRLAILTEEVGEVARLLTPDHWSSNRDESLFAELVQVAAVALAWLDGIATDTDNGVPN